jgi:hypothetical protein
MLLEGKINKQSQDNRKQKRSSFLNYNLKLLMMTILVVTCTENILKTKSCYMQNF